MRGACRMSSVFQYSILGTCFVLLVWLLYTFMTPQPVTVTDIVGTVEVKKNNEVKQVQVQVYGEALCPDTSSFVESALSVLVSDQELLSQINFEYIAFGKGSCTAESCSCQHGQTECAMNKLLNCVINALVKPQLYLPVLICLQGRVKQGTCLDHLEAKMKHQIETCSSDAQGQALMVQAERKTNSITPRIAFVPWVVIDGERTWQSHTQFVDILCNKLKEPKPKSCVINI